MLIAEIYTYICVSDGETLLKKDKVQFEKTISDLTLLAINNKRIVSEDYLSFFCHSAFQVLMNDTTVVIYNKSNPMIDKILTRLRKEKLIGSIISANDGNFYDQHFYHLTVRGAWVLGSQFKNSLDIIKAFNVILKLDQGICCDDPDIVKMLEKTYGPYISLDGPLTW